MSAGPLGIDRPVDVSLRIANRIGRIIRQRQPVMIAGDEFEALPRRLQKPRCRTRPGKHLYVVDLRRLQPPSGITDGELPAVEITREVNRHLIFRDPELVAVRQNKYDIVSPHKISKSAA